MRTRSPDFFLVGAPKCGTTAMHAYLRQHPQIFMPAQKELHYYGSDLHGLPTTLRPEQHDALFEGAGEDDRVGVTAIWALYSREAAREIKADHPGARIVIMLRDPIEMIYALHSEHLYQAIEDIGSFPMALEAEAGRLSGRSPLPASYPAALYDYRAIATFSEQVGRYLAIFGEDRVHVILQEDLARDPASVIRGLLTFLDVDPGFGPEFPRVNVNKRVRSVAFQHLLYNPTRPARRLLRRMFPFTAARRRLVDAAVEWNVVRTPRPPLSRDLRRRLQAEFAPEVDRLGRLLGRDLGSVWQTQPRPDVLAAPTSEPAAASRKE
jgi:hypothetical protein